MSYYKAEITRREIGSYNVVKQLKKIKLYGIRFSSRWLMKA